MKVGIKQFVKLYSVERGISVTEADKQVRAFLKTTEKVLLSHGCLSFMGLFTINVVTRKERVSLSPSTGKRVHVPSYRNLKIRTGKKFKEELNK